MTDKIFAALRDAATQLIQARYEPKRHVIASAAMGASGKIYTAVNLDSYLRRAAICAEAGAIAAAMTAGEKSITAILAMRHDREFDHSIPQLVAPCGICRELIADYGMDATVFVPSENKDFSAETVSSLLPNRYAKQGKNGN
ncbi:MAG TPA: cytidine deaminase [Alphaproteobacteria bacterium]|nr:cytidine deaminase [Rhodospirillaceae bacterium]HRJ12130.1 cytidine deaminase [Alphaproteobacteria bacterium]